MNNEKLTIILRFFIFHYSFLISLLHTLRHFNSQQSHAVLQSLGHVGGEDESQHLLFVVVGAEYAS